MRCSAKKAGLRKKGRFFYALFLGLLVLPVWADDFEKAEQWQRLGAHELALSELDNVQQAFANSDAAVWEQAERLRISLNQSLGRHKAVLERHRAQPAGLSQGFQLWLAMQAVEAQLALQDTDAAFELVESSIWSSGAEEALQIWRALLIQVYSAQQKDEAVGVAWRRFNQDRAEALEDADLSQLIVESAAAARRAYARVLIRQEKYAEAAALLADDGSNEGRLLFAATQLLVSGDTAGQVYDLAKGIAEAENASSAQRRMAYSLMARAASRQKNHQQSIDALVEALAIPGADQSGLFPVNADSLWTGYESWGTALALAAGLDSHNENEWAAALKHDAPAIHKVALASVLVLNGRSAQNREQALEVLAAALRQVDRGVEQSVWLLHGSDRLRQGYANMPDSMSQAVLRVALFAADIEAIKAFRQRSGPVKDLLADQENGLLDVHARLLLGESAPVSQFLNQGLENLGAWFRVTQLDLLVLLRDLEAGGYHALVIQAGRKLASASSEADIRLRAAEHACRAMLKLGRAAEAARLAVDYLPDVSDVEQAELPLLAYEALWRADMRSDAEVILQRYLNSPALFSKAADLRRRLQVPTSQ